MNTDLIVVAEIGCNHKGSMDIAKEMVLVAATFCKADVVKFQKRTNKELLSPEMYNAPHPNPINAYGKTYGEHREFLEFNIDQHKELKEWCEINNVIYSSSVWDLTAAKEIVSLQPKIVKIPSASNLNFKMLEWICDNYEGEVQLSLGMTSQKEEELIVNLFQKKHRANDLTLFACTSGYPVPFEDISLLEITRLKSKFSGIVKNIGFSGHHLGIAVDIAAFTLGARIFERHFTLDRTWKGTDHAASLEPQGLRKLCRDLRNVEKSLTYKKAEILDIEKEQRKKLKWHK
ncbi:N-acetylneuraminate synthase family protein [Sediminispirochaeta smaragdinae]|uniref:N-acetylneuraminate synthase n=1 Tax=Sediminispirochaeta smaragdinae (strain DSM 11293 / JCM 15392 / SEBR 4228) TaxID=573413 RepID=E1RA18_SEDSS|nr:N-acetylneuraminate synthase family protein [Sediminispirochaeta smaragdinae]ADK83337.1 N-acetylneuraminate synthase [Sediminispirochaeta smaragdinae DSM 11293]